MTAAEWRFAQTADRKLDPPLSAHGCYRTPVLLYERGMLGLKNIRVVFLNLVSLTCDVISFFSQLRDFFIN